MKKILICFLIVSVLVGLLIGSSIEPNAKEIISSDNLFSGDEEILVVSSSR